MLLARLESDSSTACGVRLRKTWISAWAPTSPNAFAESYSELVPGNAGMMTLGFLVLVVERLDSKVEVKVSASLVEGSSVSG